MGQSTHPGSSAAPRTHVGRWLRAAMLGQRELRDRLLLTLNGGSKGWNDDEPAVVEVAAELVLRRYFGPDETSPEDITWLAQLVSASMAQDERPLDERQAETVIRSALGEERSALEALLAVDRFRLRGIVASLASLKMELHAAEVDALLREAERVAFERGWHPQLVPRSRSGAQRH